MPTSTIVRRLSFASVAFAIAASPALVGCNVESGEDAASSEDDLGGACSTASASALVDIGTAPADGEYVATIPAESVSATSWGTKDDEAVVLEIERNGQFVSHVVLHQGATRFTYATFTGVLSKGDVIRAKVSALTAAKATKQALLCGAKLTPASALGAMADAVTHAPIYVRPLAKRFDDVPMVIGYSRSSTEYVTVLTNENGGTCALCGGGAKGLAKEILFWGRGADIEGSYNAKSGAFERCPDAGGQGTLRYEGTHPFLYHGDGHNRMFENRAGYGAACGDSNDKKPDGDLAGWGKGNADPKDDLKYSLILRPVPVDSDAISYGRGGMPRERLIASYAPWLLRLTGLETAREGKIDQKQTFSFDRYLHADLYVGDVGGTTQTCLPFGIHFGEGGFVLRVKMKDGRTISNGLITKATCDGTQWKHVAIPLDRAYSANDVEELVFDAYDGDGIYLFSVGDAYILQADGANGAKIDSIRKGDKTLDAYVDDDNSSCKNGVNELDGKPYSCKGSFFAFAP
jgi:hypothetical protein